MRNSDVRTLSIQYAGITLSSGVHIMEFFSHFVRSIGGMTGTEQHLGYDDDGGVIPNQTLRNQTRDTLALCPLPRW